MVLYGYSKFHFYSDLKKNKGSILKAAVEFMKELKRDNCKLHIQEENQRVMKAKNQKQLFRIFVSTCMKCGDNEQKSKPKVKKKTTKQSENNHGPLQKLKVRSGALEK